MQVQWECDMCGKAGAAEADENSGVWEVYQSLMDDHCDRSPECVGGRDTIRIIQSSSR